MASSWRDLHARRIPGPVAGSGVPAKLGLVGAVAALRSGWYAIPKAHLFHELDGSSGVAVALGSVTSFAGGLLPLGVGVLAAHVDWDRRCGCC